MFKHTLPVCQAGSDTLSWALCERGHAALAVFHTHMHTHTATGAWASCFHGNRCQQSSHGGRRTCCKVLQRSLYVCVCVYMCVCTILSCEEPRCSGTHWAHSSLDPSLPALVPPHTDTHPSQLYKYLEEICRLC